MALLNSTGKGWSLRAIADFALPSRGSVAGMKSDRVTESVKRRAIQLRRKARDGGGRGEGWRRRAVAFSQDGGALLLLLVPGLPAADGTINHRRLSVNAKRKERERKRKAEREGGRAEGAREDRK